MVRSIRTEPPSNFAIILSTPSLPSSFRSCYGRRRPPGAATVIGTSPPIPDFTVSPTTCCSGELPPPHPCQASSLSPTHARVGRPATPSPSASPRFPRHRDRPARGDQRRSARRAARPGQLGRFSCWARPMSLGLGLKSGPTLCGRLNSFSN
jgi:hypothetical protein